MKYLLIILLFLPSLAIADVDLYLQAHEYWKRGKPTTDWTKKDFREFWRQTHKGDIIDILEAGRNPGREVHPPTFVKITVTGVTIEQARAYLEELTDDSLLLLRDSASENVKPLLLLRDSLQIIFDSLFFLENYFLNIDDSLLMLQTSVKIDSILEIELRVFQKIDSLYNAINIFTDEARVKQRRFFFERWVVDSALTLWDVDSSHITITKQQANNLLKKYDISAIKQKIRNRLKQ